MWHTLAFEMDNNVKFFVYPLCMQMHRICTLIWGSPELNFSATNTFQLDENQVRFLLNLNCTPLPVYWEPHEAHLLQMNILHQCLLQCSLHLPIDLTECLLSAAHPPQRRHLVHHGALLGRRVVCGDTNRG